MSEKLERSELILIAVVSFFGLTGVLGLALREPPPQVSVIQSGPGIPTDVGVGVETSLAGRRWFESFRRYCNPVEVESSMARQPAPSGPDGGMYEAACYALAGRIDRARDTIEGLPRGLRSRAAGLVFEVGHPAADAGDDVAAGPLMELVLEYQPRNYMALYHAGAARFQRGDYDLAESYLKRFLAEYSAEDYWGDNARSMLERMS